MWNSLMEMTKTHVPVMCREVIAHLGLRPEMVVVDATVGLGGHSQEILPRIMPGGKLIGIDQDQDALDIAGEALRPYEDNIILIKDNFQNIRQILAEQGIPGVDAILFDLGVSSLQLETPERGFSFQSEGPLNMRMDKTGRITAYDLVNNLSAEELARILWMFGEERFSRRIARLIVARREKEPVSTTRELAEIIKQALPKKFLYSRLHPATRAFQALRIAVNRELEVLPRALEDGFNVLRTGGRVCVISFHSLEDRLVKNTFRGLSRQKVAQLITKKPLTPTESEILENPRSRSAKMRVIEKT